MTQSEINSLIRIQARRAVLAAAAQATNATADILYEYVDNFAKSTKNRKSSFEKIYRQAGEAGQQAILKAYDKKHGRSRSYRQNDRGKWRRYSNGALRRALASNEMWRATPSGLNFINPRFLDSQAEQWWKLSFGAAPRPVTPHKAATMRFFGQSVKGFELEGKPSDAFAIPPGFFSTEAHAKTPKDGVRRDGGPNFYPVALMSGLGAPNQRSAKSRRELGRWLRSNGGTVRRMSQGIRGTRYLDAGVDEINRILPKLVEDQIMGWLDEARKGVKSKTGKTIRVPGSGPLGRFQGMSPQMVSSLNRRRA